MAILYPNEGKGRRATVRDVGFVTCELVWGDIVSINDRGDGTFATEHIIERSRMNAYVARLCRAKNAGAEIECRLDGAFAPTEIVAKIVTFEQQTLLAAAVDYRLTAQLENELSWLQQRGLIVAMTPTVIRVPKPVSVAS